jgi:hypothetical protein
MRRRTAMRRRLVAALAGLVLAAAGLVATPGAAAADNPPPTLGRGIPFGDGYLYAWQYWGYAGSMCRWYDADDNWDTTPCGFSMRNKASALFNNSAFGNPVNLYYHPGYTGAWACLGAGDYWDDLANRHFSWGPGRNGYGQSADDNIASHRWRNPALGCGNHNP